MNRSLIIDNLTSKIEFEQSKNEHSHKMLKRHQDNEAEILTRRISIRDRSIEHYRQAIDHLKQIQLPK